MKYIVLALAFGLLLLLPFPQSGERGAYNTWSGLAWCKDYSACLHEIGHALDREAGWISQTPAFAQALQMYLLTGARIDNNVIILLAVALSPADGRERTKRELYAWLFELAGGKKENMPVGLRDFYDWELAERYITRVDGGGLLWLP